MSFIFEFPTEQMLEEHAKEREIMSSRIGMLEKLDMEIKDSLTKEKAQLKVCF